MPTRKKTNKPKHSMATTTPKQKSVDLPSAPLVPGVPSSRSTIRKSRRQEAYHIGKQRGAHHITIVQKRSAKVAIAVSRGYKATDHKIITVAKKIVPEKTRTGIAQNRAANNGNIKLAVPLPAKANKKLFLTVPGWLRHARHAALPLAAITLLVLTMMPAGASPPDYAGTYRFGGSGNETGKAIAIDSAGNSFAVGSFEGTTTFDGDFGGSPTDSKSASGTVKGGYITKTNANGSYGWTRSLTGTEANAAVVVTTVATDTSGNIFAAGTFKGTDSEDEPSSVDFRADWGGGTDIHASSAADKSFVTKINSDGSYGWTRSYGDGDTNTVIAASLATDSSGNVYVGGNFTGDVPFDAHFGGSPLDTKTNVGSQDGFITTIASNGDYRWTHQFGGTQSDSVTSILVSGSTVIAGGTFVGTVDFSDDFAEVDDDSYSSDSGSTDGFISKIATNGTDYTSTKHIGGSGDIALSSLKLAAGNIIYVSGSFSGQATFGTAWSASATKTARGNQDGFALILPSTGEAFDAAYQFGSSSQTVSVSGIALDSNNMIYAAGTFTGTVDFSQDFNHSNPQTSHGTSSGFITSFSKTTGENPTYDWTRVYGAEETDETPGIATITSIAATGDDVYAFGQFSETINFSASYTSTDNKSASNTDAFRTALTAGPAHTITGTDGLRIEDTAGTDLGDIGTRTSTVAVHVFDEDNDLLLARGTVDLTSDRVWTGVSGDSNISTHTMVLAGVRGAAGLDTGSYELYVPRNTGDKAVIICPSASELEDVTITCSGKQTYSVNDSGVSTVNIGSVDYWKLTNISDPTIGAMSVPTAGIELIQSGGSTTITENGSSDSFTVRLNAKPAADVTVTFSDNPSNQIDTIEPLVFTSANWNDAQTVTIDALDDNTIEGNHNVDLSYAITSTDALYDDISQSSAVGIAITDNDSAGITWLSNSVVTSESDDPGDGASTEVCLALTARPSTSVTINLSSAHTNEVVLVDNSIVIAPADWDDTENCAGIRGVADTTTDGPKSVDISITSITGDANFASLDSGTLDKISVTNQDTNSANLVVTTPDGTTTSETGDEAQLCVALTAAPATGNVTIPITAPGVVSLSRASFVLTSSNWEDGQCATLTGQDDNKINSSTSYVVTPGSVSAADTAWQGVSTTAINAVSFTNTDDDTAELVISKSSLQVQEGGSDDSVTVRLSSQPQAGKQVVVHVTAAQSSQLTVTNGELTFTDANWNTPQTVNIEANDDALLESAHQSNVLISIQNSTDDTDYASLSQESITTDITDNDTATASISATKDATETAGNNPSSNGNFSVQLTKANNTGSDIVLTYSIAGTATNGSDYGTISTTIAIPNGASSANIPVVVLGHNNALLEGNATVLLTLLSSSESSVSINSGASVASVTIFDDETATASLSTSQNGLEANEQAMEFTVTLSTANHTGSPITFAITTTGGSASADDDYDSLAAATIDIPDGQTTGTLEVSVIDDALLEAVTESVNVAITDPSHSQVSIANEQDTASATITDNDSASVSFSAPVATTIEGSATSAQIAVTLDKTNNTGSNITVTYTIGGTAVANTDYDALGTTATIANGQTSTTIDITSEDFDNNARAANKTVQLTYASSSLSGRISAGTATASITITDDEIADVTSSVIGSTNENGGTAQICFALASRPSDTVTIGLSSTDTDKVTLASANVVITPSNWNQPNNNCVTATGHNDTPAQITGNQSVTITTGSVTSNDSFYAALTAGDIDDISVTHGDNDTPDITATIVSGQNHTNEAGDKTVTLQFTLASQPSSAVTVPLTISDASEGSFSDSTSDTTQDIIISPSDWNTASENQITIYGVDDALNDGTIAYDVELGTLSSSDNSYDELEPDTTLNLANEDNDTANATISQTGGSTTVAEGGATDTINVAVTSQPAGSNVAVITATPANNQIDIGAGAGQPVDLTFTASNWATPQTLTVTAVNDSDLESTHTANIAFSVNTAASTEPSYQNYNGSLSPISVTISDDESATATLSATRSGNESGPVALQYTVTLNRENRTGSSITVQLNPSGGSATAVSDYANFASTTVSVANGSSSGIASIGVVDDNILEGNETVQATIGSSSLGAVSIADSSASASIIDNDSTTATITATQPSAAEHPSTNGQFTVSLGRVNNTGSPIAVNYTTTGSSSADNDYAQLSGSVAIANGQSNALITVDTTGYDDDDVEPNETVVVTLNDTNNSLVTIGSPASATVSIADDDSFTWSIAKTQDGAEAGSVPATFTVSLSHPNTTGGSLSVSLQEANGGSATADDDYEGFDSDTVTIPNGEQSALVTVPVLNDTDLEGTESFGVTIHNPSEGNLGTATATATIADNETGELTITASDDSAAENPAQNGEFTITLNKTNHRSSAILVQYTVNGTATAGDDYATLSGTAMIASGQSSTTITVNTTNKNDAIHEGDETVLVSLASTNVSAVTIGSPNEATVTIADDDPEETTPPPTEEPTETPTPPTTPIITTVIVPVTKKTAQTAEASETPVPAAITPIIEQPTLPVDQVPKDIDRDDILDTEEAKALNHGDGNGDGTPDSLQKNVASRISPVTKKPITLEAEGECSTVTGFTTVSQASLKKADSKYKYPEGLVDFKLLCSDMAQQANVTVYYDKVLSSGQWRKFLGRDSKGSYTSLLSVQLGTHLVGKQTVSTVHYTITDGGVLDDDGKADGMIKDPAGLAMKQLYVWDKVWILLVMAVGIWLILHITHKHHARQQSTLKRSSLLRERTRP